MDQSKVSHEHSHGHASHGHTHGAVDATLFTTEVDPRQ
jgi:hypothetical protein